jgi:hypothetical protein
MSTDTSLADTVFVASDGHMTPEWHAEMARHAYIPLPCWDCGYEACQCHEMSIAASLTTDAPLDAHRAVCEHGDCVAYWTCGTCRRLIDALWHEGGETDGHEQANV